VIDTRPLGTTGLEMTPIGFGAFKIGRNRKTKYQGEYELPDEAAAAALLADVLDLGIGYLDTAPAYGLSEQRIGSAIGHRGREFVLSTKVGEHFENEESSFDFSAEATRASIRRSCERLKRDVLDLVFVHSDGNDLAVLEQTDVVETLVELKQAGTVRAIGFSGKTVDGAAASLDWADAIMVEYHARDVTHADVISEAAARGVGVVVKKGLASGHLAPAEAIPFVLSHPGVTSLVVGSLDLQHLEDNLTVARLT